MRAKSAASARRAPIPSGIDGCVAGTGGAERVMLGSPGEKKVSQAARHSRTSAAKGHLDDRSHDALLEQGALPRPHRRAARARLRLLCALVCVREAERPDVDLVIPASRDTDLTPALDEVHDAHCQEPDRYAGIKTVAWFDKDAHRHFGQLRPTEPRRLWNTNLDRACCDAALDRLDYR